MDDLYNELKQKLQRIVRSNPRLNVVQQAQALPQYAKQVYQQNVQPFTRTEQLKIKPYTPRSVGEAYRNIPQTQPGQYLTRGSQFVQNKLPEIPKFTAHQNRPTSTNRLADRFLQSQQDKMELGSKITHGLFNLPGEIIKDTARTTEKIGQGKKLNAWDFLNLYDVATPGLPEGAIAGGIAGLPFVKGGLRNVSEEGFEKVGKESLERLTRVKSLADNTDTARVFAYKIKQIPNAVETIKKAGFNNIDDFWKSNHEGSIKLSKLFNETLAQTKFRQANKPKPQLWKDNDFVKSLGEINIPVTKKVNILDQIRTPDRVLKKIGLEEESKMIRKGWDNYLDEMPKEVERITQWSQQVSSPQSNRLIFKYLDGQLKGEVLEPQDLKVANEIKSYLKQWANRLDLPEDKRITNYITRIWEKDVEGTEFPAEIAALIRDKVPGSVYDPFVQKRLGVSGYVEDTWRALDAYIKRATRLVNMDLPLQRIEAVTKDFEDSQFRYVKNYIDKVNMRPTNIDNEVDNLIKSVVGYRFTQRPVAYATTKLRRWTYRGLLGLKPSSALKNLSQAANTYAELGEKWTVVGYTKMARDLPDYLRNKPTELDKVGVLRDNFIQDRQLNATKNLMQKVDKGLFYMFELAEKINRGAAYHGAKARALSKGKSLDDAVQEAIETVRKTQFTFGAVDTPVAMQSDIAKTMTQFMSYSVKQAEFLGEKVSNKEWAGIARYVAASYLFIATVGKAFGMQLTDMIPSVRVGVPPTMQLPKGVVDVATGAEDEYGNEPDSNLITRILENKDIQQGLTNYIPGGSQMIKTYQGLNDYRKGESTTKSGDLRYPINQTKGNLAKSTLFGKYSTPEAREYYDNEQQPLGKDQSSFVRNASDKFQAYMDVRKGSELRAEEQKVKDIVKGSGVATYFGDKYLYYDKDSDEVRSINTDFVPTKPKMTGSPRTDEKLISQYKSDITKREGIVEDMLKQGLITSTEAESELKDLQTQQLNFELESMDLQKPELSGNKVLDKKILSNYKSLLTKRESLVLELWESKQINLDEAEKELSKIQNLRDQLKVLSGSGSGAKSTKLPKLGKLTFSKTKLPQVKEVKKPVIKLSSPKDPYTELRKILSGQSLKAPQIKTKDLRSQIKGMNF